MNGYNKGVEGKWVACKDSPPWQEKSELRGVEEEGSFAQDRVSKAETEAGHPFPHSFPVLKGPWGNAYLHWEGHMTSEIGVRGQARYAQCEAADKGLASSLSPPPLHTTCS